MAPRENSNNNNNNNNNNSSSNNNTSTATNSKATTTTTTTTTASHSHDINDNNDINDNAMNERRKRQLVVQSALKKTKQQEQNRVEPSMQSYIPSYLRRIIIPYHGDFCRTSCFHPKLIVQLMAEGFLPIATRGSLLPKLHIERSVIVLGDATVPTITAPTTTTGSSSSSSAHAHAHAYCALHIAKSTRKKASKFTLTFNRAFRQVVQGCHDQHEQCWLYPPLVEAFERIQQDYQEAVVLATTASQPTTTNYDDAAVRQSCRVRLYSVECWNTEGVLVAGELGYTVGSCYTSLTGFSNTSSAGSVQLAALGRQLVQQGFTLWDLGMDMEYKRNLGATLMPRRDFVRHIQSVRCHYVALMMEVTHDNNTNTNTTISKLREQHQPVNCRTIIDAGTGGTGATQTAVAPASLLLVPAASSYNNNNNVGSSSRQKPKFRTNKRSPKKLKSVQPPAAASMATK